MLKSDDGKQGIWKKSADFGQITSRTDVEKQKEDLLSIMDPPCCVRRISMRRKDGWLSMTSAAAFDMHHAHGIRQAFGLSSYRSGVSSSARAITKRASNQSPKHQRGVISPFLFLSLSWSVSLFVQGSHLTTYHKDSEGFCPASNLSTQSFLTPPPISP